MTNDPSNWSPYDAIETATQIGKRSAPLKRRSRDTYIVTTLLNALVILAFVIIDALTHPNWWGSLIWMPSAVLTVWAVDRISRRDLPKDVR